MRSAGNPHYAYEVAGIGNGNTDDPTNVSGLSTHRANLDLSLKTGYRQTAESDRNRSFSSDTKTW